MMLKAIDSTVIRKFMQNPLVILASITAGGAVGIQLPEYAAVLRTYGNIFLALFELCFIPLIMASVALSVHNLVQSHVAKKSMGRIVTIALIFMLLGVVVSLLMGLILKPGEAILASTSEKIHEISLAASVLERQTSQAFELGTTLTFAGFILDMIPNNIFVALGESKIFQIVIFSIMIGIALGFVKPETGQGGHRFFEVLYELFQRIIYGVSLLLPVAIFCMMAGDVAKVGLETILPMGTFIGKMYLVFTVTFLIALVVIKVRAQASLTHVMDALKDSWFLAFGTRSSIIPIPTVIAGMAEKLKFNTDMVTLMVPLGNVMGRFGNMIYFSFVVLFTFELYRFSVTPQVFLMLLPLLILAGIGTAGTSGVLTLAMLGLVLDAFQLPLGAILSLLVAVDSLIEPGRTLLNVVFNSAAVSIMAKRE